MKVPELPSQGDVFDTIEIAHERFLASTYPLTGFGLKHSHSASGDTHTFYCRSGRSSGGVNGKLEKCDFRIRVTVDLASGKCTIGQIEDEHNHDKHPKLVADPHYIPSNGSKVAKVMERLQAQDIARIMSALPAIPQVVEREESVKAEVPTSPFSINHLLNPVTPQKRSREDEEEVELECSESEYSSLFDSFIDDTAISHIATSETKSIVDCPSLEHFLGSLSCAFDLAQHAKLFRSPKIGIVTSAQLLEVAGENMEGLIGQVSETLGFGPTEMLRIGLQKRLKK